MAASACHQVIGSPLAYQACGISLLAAECVVTITLVHPEKVRYKVIGGEMKGMESSMNLVALGATQRKG